MAETSNARQRPEDTTSRQLDWIPKSRLRSTALFFALMAVYPLQGLLRALTDSSTFRVGRALLLGVLPYGVATTGLWRMRLWGWWFGAVLAFSWVIDYFVKLIGFIRNSELETVVLGLLFFILPLSLAGNLWGREVTERVGLKPERRRRAFLLVTALALAYWAALRWPSAR